MQIELSVLSLTLSHTTAEDLKNSMSRFEGLVHESQRYSGTRPLSQLVKSGLPDVIIFEFDEHSEDALEDIKNFLLQHHHTEVIATFPNADVQLVKQLMRIGVRDVLSQPISHQDITIALSNALSRHRSSSAQESGGKVSAYLNTRGGAGASFISLNIAYQLATEFKQKTVLIDLDIQYGTVAVDLDIRSDNTILEALRHPARIDNVYLDALLTRHESGLYVLPSPGDLSPSDDISAQAVSKLVTTLEETHDQVIINLPTHFNEAVEQALRLANPVFLVTQDTMAMLRNLKMLLQRLPTRGIPGSHLNVIQNRVNTAVKDISSKEMEDIVGDTPTHRVRSDYKLAAHAANEGKAATELSNRAGMVRDIRDISAMLAGADASDAKIKRGLMRWLS